MVPSSVKGCELRMDALAAMASPEALREAVSPMVTHYRTWIEQQRATPLDTDARRELAGHLLDQAARACDRIAVGLAQMDDPQVFEAFCRANRAMADAARHRSPQRYAPREEGGGGATPTRVGGLERPLVIPRPPSRPAPPTKFLMMRLSLTRPSFVLWLPV